MKRKVSKRRRPESFTCLFAHSTLFRALSELFNVGLREVTKALCALKNAQWHDMR